MSVTLVACEGPECEESVGIAGEVEFSGVYCSLTCMESAHDESEGRA